jgi:hypothetical protein
MSKDLEIIDGLRSIARATTPMVLDIYDKEDQSSLLPSVARIVGGAGSGDPALKERDGNLEWANAFPEMRQWVGERTTQKAFTGKIPWTAVPYEVTLEFNKWDALRPSALIKAQDLGGVIARSFASGKTLLAYNVLRNNAVAYDGQNMFDLSHVHPDGSTYANLQVIPRVDPVNPTVSEARDELVAAEFGLMQNRLIRNQLAMSTTVASNIVVFVHSAAVWRVYDKLRTWPSFGADKNIYQNAFTLVMDYKPLAGTENYVDFVFAEPSGPRPAIFIPIREPSGLEFDISNLFKNAQIPFGMDAEYAVASGLPQTCYRVKPS